MHGMLVKSDSVDVEGYKLVVAWYLYCFDSVNEVVRGL